MAIITIPKKLTKRDDLIVIPRKEYEALLFLKQFREFRPTATQKKALRLAESKLQRNKTLSYHELVKKLGFTN